MNKNDHPLISIIVPIYNAEAFLERCLSSIQQQHFGDFEVLMIDDGSTDRSGAIAGEFAAQDSRFHLISQENLGVSAARNAGLERAQGVWLLFVDSDDEVLPDYAASLLEAAGESRLVVCDYLQKDWETGEEMAHFTVPAGAYSKKAYILRMARCPGAHYVGVLWNKLYARRLVEERQLRFVTDLSLGEDFLFNMDYLSAVDEVCCLEGQPYVYCWKQPSSLTNAKQSLEASIALRKRFYQAYCGLYRREGMDKSQRFWMCFYIFKWYSDTLEEFQDADSRRLLYAKCIRESRISPIEYLIYTGLKRVRGLLK